MRQWGGDAHFPPKHIWGWFMVLAEGPETHLASGRVRVMDWPCLYLI